MVAATTQAEESYTQVRHRWLVQATVGLGLAITTMDTGGINVSLYTLARHFQVDAPTIAWLPLITFLMATSTLLLFGRLADMVGGKLVFIAGFAIYASGSLMGGLAPSLPFLLLARAVQALGISALTANSTAILLECFPPHERGKALGVNSSLVGLGFFIGPITAGFLIANLGWRYVFFASMPLCLIGMLASASVLPSSKKRSSRQFDFAGALLFAIASVCLLLAVNSTRTAPLTSPMVLGFGIVAVLTMGMFILVERRVSEPMLDLGLFRVRLFSCSLASAFILFFSTAGQDFLVPLFSQQILKLDPAAAGLAASTVPLVRMLMSWPSGILTDKFGSRWLSGIGSILVGIGILGLSLMDASTSVLWLSISLAIVGLGAGVYFSPNMLATMASVPASRMGMASGALALRRNLGQSFGVALTAYLLQSGSGGVNLTVAGFQLSFTSLVFYIVVATVLAFAAGSTLSARQRIPAVR